VALLFWGRVLKAPTSYLLFICCCVFGRFSVCGAQKHKTPQQQKCKKPMSKKYFTKSKLKKSSIRL
jgi:hypothetical protein